IIQSRFTKLGVVPIDNQHYLYATLDNNLIGIIVLIKTCDNHYYDEDNIKVEKIPANTGSSVSGLSASTVLTEEDKEKAREAALRRLEEEQYALLKKKPTRAKKEIIEVQQMSLF
ncbi:Cas9 inhibitor AcrIIA9 family protein, partial [Bacteroides fragilis]|uniref:Cas9 inhibitor AcrIIA9 family protein n=1 Tax=Bacteroides fragilis TaxID=817 RepID=UPI00202E0D51